MHVSNKMNRDLTMDSERRSGAKCITWLFHFDPCFTTHSVPPLKIHYRFVNSLSLRFAFYFDYSLRSAVSPRFIPSLRTVPFHRFVLRCVLHLRYAPLHRCVLLLRFAQLLFSLCSVPFFALLSSFFCSAPMDLTKMEHEHILLDLKNSLGKLNV